MAQQTKLEGYNSQALELSKMFVQLISTVGNDARSDVERVTDQMDADMGILRSAMEQISKNQMKLSQTVRSNWSTEAPAATKGKNRIPETLEDASNAAKDVSIEV